MIPGGLLVVEGYLQWAGAQGEVEGHLAEAVGVAEEASYHQEVVEEVGLFLQSLVEAPGRQGGRGQQEGRQEQQLPASAETHGNKRGSILMERVLLHIQWNCNYKKKFYAFFQHKPYHTDS